MKEKSQGTSGMRWWFENVMNVDFILDWIISSE